ncbi:transcriptional regulator [Streptomyces griseocarneus]|nr:transcriptional regulator [Streptomyces griseocarneus]
MAAAGTRSTKTVAPVEPPISWRYCGSQMMMWRTEAGISREKLAEEAGYVPESIKSMEQGRRKPVLRVLEVADQMCGANGKLKAAHPYLQADRPKARNEEFRAAELDAIACHAYQMVLVPGLLQTEEYARALIGSACPPVDQETIERRVADRLQRQKMLMDKPGEMFTFVIYELALRTGVGGPDVMRRQMQHLLEVAELPNVALQILPAEQGAFGWLDGTMVILESSEFVRHVYTEHHGDSTLHSEPEKVSAFVKRYGMLQAQALNPTESAHFLRKLTE